VMKKTVKLENIDLEYFVIGRLLEETRESEFI